MFRIGTDSEGRFSVYDGEGEVFTGSLRDCEAWLDHEENLRHPCGPMKRILRALGSLFSQDADPAPVSETAVAGRVFAGRVVIDPVDGESTEGLNVSSKLRERYEAAAPR